MAAKRRTRRDSRLSSETLLHSLEAQVGKLKLIQVDDERAMATLQEAIDELKRDAKILKVIGPHIFIFIPKKK